jgi:hypothetical protein
MQLKNNDLLIDDDLNRPCKSNHQQSHLLPLQ